MQNLVLHYLNIIIDEDGAASWLPFDIFMEDAMEGRQLPTTFPIEMLDELIKSPVVADYKGKFRNCLKICVC